MDLVGRRSTVGDSPVLHLSGEVDLATLPALHDCLSRLVHDHLGAVVMVDLDGVQVLDDAGLGLLMGAAGRARDHGGDLVLVCTAAPLLQRFALTGLDRAVQVRPSLHAPAS